MEVESGTETTNSSTNQPHLNNHQKQFSWQDIQKHTFAGWCNAILADKNITITNLYDDLHDGTVLMAIYEQLSGNPPPKHNKTPRIPQQIIENLDIVMKLFQQDGLTTVNIGPMDIFEKNEKLILGFVWHLILYYQIGTSLMVTPNNERVRAHCGGKLSPGVAATGARVDPDLASPLNRFYGDDDTLKTLTTAQLDVENDTEQCSPDHRRCSGSGSSVRQTLERVSLEESSYSPTKLSPPGGVIRRASLRAKPQKLILDWVSSVLCEFTIKNLTTDWNDGIMLGALINRFDPSCCANYKKWKKSNAIQNVTEALEASQAHLHIPTIIKPEHLASGQIDPQSLMTYVSQFTKKGAVAFTSTFNRLKRLAPSVAKLVATMDQHYWNDGVALASLVSLCCSSNTLQGGFYRKVTAYEGDGKKAIETRSIYNIASALMEAENFLNLQPTFTPEDLFYQKVHPIVFVTYVNHLLNILEFKEQDECFETNDADSAGVIEFVKGSRQQLESTIVLSQEGLSKHPPLESSHLLCSTISQTYGTNDLRGEKLSSSKHTTNPQLEMSWVSDTESCLPGDELKFKIKNFSQFNATFDNVHVEITYFKDDEEYKKKFSKVLIPFQLYQLDSNTIDGSFCAAMHGIYRVQASINGKLLQPALYKKTSSSDDPTPVITINNSDPRDKTFETNDFECVFRESHGVIDKDFILTVYSSKHVNPQEFDFIFQSTKTPSSKVYAQLDYSDSLRYIYRTQFGVVGSYTLHVREKSSGKVICYNSCVAVVGDPSKITFVSNNDAFVSPGEIIQLVCDITDAGPGCLSAEVIYENKFFGYASVSSKTEASRLHAVVTYIVPVIICGTFEFKLKWNDFPLDNHLNSTAVNKRPLQFISFDPSKAIVQGDGLKGTIPIGREQYFTITVNNIKCIKKIEGFIKMLEDLSNKKTKIELLPDNHNTYVGRYELGRVGTYQLDLFINGRPVFETPFLIESIDLDYVKVKVESEPRVIHQQFLVKVYVYKKAGKGDLFYSLEGPNGPLKMSIEPLQNDNEVECFLLCSDTNCTGSYTMDLTYGGYSIKHFPKVFSVSNFEIDERTVTVDSAGKLGCLTENTEGQFEFTVNALDRQRDSSLFTGHIVELDQYENITKLTPIEIKPANKNGTFVGCLPAVSAQARFLNVFFNKIPLPGNPYPLEVFKQSCFSLSVKNDIDHIYVNDLVTIVLKTPIQFYEKQLNCSLKVNSNNETITIEKGNRIQTPSPCCEFEYCWSPTAATTYEICAFFNDAPLFNTLTTVQVAAKPLRNLIKDHNVMLKADDEVAILPTDEGQISPRIVMNERGSTLYLSGYMLSNSGNVKLPLKFKQEASLNDGVKLVHAWYYHALPGVYSVWINYDDKPLDNTPFSVEILETSLFAVAPDHQYLDKPLPCGGPAPHKYHFYVTVPSSAPLQHCVLSVESPRAQKHFIQLINDCEEIATFNDSVRQLRVPFNEPTHGTHHVGLVYKTHSIENTFKHISIQVSQLDVSQICVEINRPEYVLYNSSHEIAIKLKGVKLRSRDSLHFEGSVRGRKRFNSSHYEQPVSFSRRANDTYICQFYVHNLDITQLCVSCESIDLIGSPFELNVIDLSKAKVVFPLFDNSQSFMCHQECMLNVYIPYNSGDAKLCVLYTDPEDESHEIPYEKNIQSRIDEYHSYCARFKPHIPGVYNLRVTYGGFDVSSSPYRFEVQPPPFAFAESTIEELGSDELHVELNSDKIYYVDESTPVSVYFKRKVNSSRLKTITIKHIDGSSHEITLTPYKDANYSGYYDKYMVDLVPKIVGSHQIQIINQATGNTYTYEFEAKKRFASGLYCVNVPDMCCVGEKFTFDVIIGDHRFPTKSVRCRCIGPNNEASFISITTNNSTRSYQVHVTPKCVGSHCLELEADKLPIQDSPYKVVVLEHDFEDSVKVSGPGLNSSVLGDYIGEFEIDVVGELGGELAVELTGPDKAYQLDSYVVRREKFMMLSSSGHNKSIEVFTVKCHYNPLLPGIYIIDIFWKGVPMKKSPFRVFLCSNKAQLDHLLLSKH